ncbi:hypothetical protein D9M73_292210 [compost metagenome]
MARLMVPEMALPLPPPWPTDMPGIPLGLVTTLRPCRPPRLCPLLWRRAVPVVTPAMSASLSSPVTRADGLALRVLGFGSLPPLRPMGVG